MAGLSFCSSGLALNACSFSIFPEGARPLSLTSGGPKAWGETVLQQRTCLAQNLCLGQGKLSCSTRVLETLSLVTSPVAFSELISLRTGQEPVA